MTQDTAAYPTVDPPKRSRPWLRRSLYAAAALAVFGIGAAVGSSAGHTVIKTVAGPVKYVKVPGPVTTKTVTQTVKVPGPTVYKVKYVPASQGPSGTTIAKFSGSGNQATGTFTVPASGNYVVQWSYGGNNNCSFGSCQGSNFAITENNSSGAPLGLPNDIAGQGHGSTEVTGDSGSPSFDVQAMAGGWWAITVISA